MRVRALCGRILPIHLITTVEYSAPLSKLPILERRGTGAMILPVRNRAGGGHIDVIGFTREPRCMGGELNQGNWESIRKLPLNRL
jgi:hypothetical protein